MPRPNTYLMEYAFTFDFALREGNSRRSPYRALSMTALIGLTSK